MKTIMLRKAIDKEYLLRGTEQLKKQFKLQPKEVKIAKVIELEDNEFVLFKDNLLKDYPFINEHATLCNETEDLVTVLLIKPKGSKDSDGILVNTEGFTYARYTGIPIVKGDDKK